MARNAFRTALAALIVALSPLEARALNVIENSKLTSKTPLQSGVTPLYLNQRTGEVTQSNYHEIIPADSHTYRALNSIGTARQTPLMDLTGPQLVSLAGMAAGAALIIKHKTKYGIGVLIPSVAIFGSDIGSRARNNHLQERVNRANQIIDRYNIGVGERNTTIRSMQHEESDYWSERGLSDELNESIDSLLHKLYLVEDTRAMKQRVIYIRKLKRLRDLTEAPNFEYETIRGKLDEIEGPISDFAAKHTPKK